jgi:hypothetical protein
MLLVDADGPHALLQRQSVSYDLPDTKIIHHAHMSSIGNKEMFH